MSNLQQGRVIEQSVDDQDQHLQAMLENVDELQQGKVIANKAFDSFEEAHHFEDDLESLSATTKPNWLGRIFVCSLLILVVTEVIFSVIEAMNSSPILAGLYGIAITTAFALIGKVAFKEFRLLRNLKSTKNHQLAAARLMDSVQIGEAQSFLTEVNKYATDGRLAKVLAQIDEHHTDKEVMSLYANTVLAEQDKQAQDIIKKYASTSGVMVAISPIALVDMAVVLWRSTKMIEDITKVYGLPLGYVSRIKLYRMTLKQMLFAGSAELISDFATTALSAELAGKLSARAAQGVSVSIFTARIGYKAMELSRPLPGLPSKKHLLTSCVKLALESVKSKGGN